MNPSCAPDYLSIDFTEITPTHYLLTHIPLWDAQFEIEAGLLTAEEARLLGLARNSPCLIMNRRTIGRGVPVTQVRMTHPGSCYQMAGQFKL